LDIGRLEFVSHFARHRDWVRAAKFSPDGKFLATAGNDARLLIWDMDNPGQVRELARHRQAIIHLDISPDGKRIAAVGFEDQVTAYNVATGRREWSTNCSCSDMDAVAYSNDGNWIAAGGRDGMIRIWDSRSGELSTEFQAQRTRIRSIEYTDDGQIVSCGDDCTVMITEPADPNGGRALPRLKGKIYAAKLLSDNRLATGGSDDLIHIWDLARLERIDALAGHAGTISCLDSMGTILASGSYDTQVRIWESRPRAAAIGPPRELRLN
jgi:WD40 repeat protein